MQPLRLARWWLLTGLGIVASVLMLALARHPPDLHMGDKMQHGLAFAALTVWFCGVFEVRRYGWIALALLMYGIGIEGLQSLTTYRRAEVMDVVADTAGIAAGLLLAAAGLRTWCGRVEAWLGVQPAR